jgi:hypothetical protein
MKNGEKDPFYMNGWVWLSAIFLIVYVLYKIGALDAFKGDWGYPAI